MADGGYISTAPTYVGHSDHATRVIRTNDYTHDHATRVIRADDYSHDHATRVIRAGDYHHADSSRVIRTVGDNLISRVRSYGSLNDSYSGARYVDGTTRTV